MQSNQGVKVNRFLSVPATPVFVASDESVSEGECSPTRSDPTVQLNYLEGDSRTKTSNVSSLRRLLSRRVNSMGQATDFVDRTND